MPSHRPPPPDLPRSPAEIIVDDHGELVGLFIALQRVESPLQAVAIVDELEPILAAHFEREEAEDGVFAAVRGRRPEDAEILDRFIEEHKAFLAALQRVRTAGEIGAMAEARELGEALAAHESEESEMVLSALYEDLTEEQPFTD